MLLTFLDTVRFSELEYELGNLKAPRAPKPQACSSILVGVAQRSISCSTSGRVKCLKKVSIIIV